MHSIDWEGRSIMVETVGHGPRAVLFIHGLGASHRCFEEANRYFDPDLYTLVQPDIPGFGQSEAPEGDDHRIESMAGAMEAVATSLGLDKVHVIAHSMGGAVALLLASSPAITVLSLASAEGNLVTEDALMSSKVSRLKEHVFERVWSKWLTMVREFLGPEPSRQHDLFLEDLGATGPRVIHRASTDCWAVTSSGELGSRFLELDCPRIYLIGEKSLKGRTVPEPVAQAGVCVVTIPGAGHFTMENHQVFYPPIVAFIEDVEAS